MVIGSSFRGSENKGTERDKDAKGKEGEEKILKGKEVLGKVLKRKRGGSLSKERVSLSRKERRLVYSGRTA